MVSGLPGRLHAVMTGGAGTDNTGVIKVRGCPGDGGMAIIT